MAKKKNIIIPSTIFDRVVSILEQARGNIVMGKPICITLRYLNGTSA
ncbi:MAG: hypothetical protein U9N73_08165 [Candidatus Auribacterota bacterium]|nr:hypothetical protein [Candidatus Auribacterota bacterium]